MVLKTAYSKLLKDSEKPRFFDEFVGDKLLPVPLLKRNTPSLNMSTQDRNTTALTTTPSAE